MSRSDYRDPSDAIDGADERDQELHALVDGRLSAERRAQVEARVAGDPETQERAQAWSEQRDALRKLGMRVSEGSVPMRFLETASPRAVGWLGWSARVSVAFAMATCGWFAHSYHVGSEQIADTRARFVRDAVSAHAVYVPEVRHPVEVGADQSAHLIQWLSKRLGAQLKAPVLQAQGYELVGGRLLPGADGARAQFMYQDASGARITLYVTTLNKSPAPSETSFRFAEGKPASAFYWIDGGFGYALTGNLPRARLLELSEVVYAQLTG